MVVTERHRRVEWSPGKGSSIAIYVVLVILGLVLGLLGGFQHSWSIGFVPVSALGCLLVLFAACRGAGWAMGGRSAALALAAGWLMTTMIWLGERPEGDVVIAADLPGYVYLYGGLIALLAGVLLTPAGKGLWLLGALPYGSGPRGASRPSAS